MTAVLAIVVIVSVVFAILYMARIVRGAVDQRNDVEWHFDAIQEELENIHPKLSKSHTNPHEGNEDPAGFRF